VFLELGNIVTPDTLVQRHWQLQVSRRHPDAACMPQIAKNLTDNPPRVASGA
jgi:hypothetical protein